LVVTPSPEAALDIGADIEEDGAGAEALLELPDEALSLLLQAVRASAATAVKPIPATRSLLTENHSICFSDSYRVFGSTAKSDCHSFE